MSNMKLGNLGIKEGSEKLAEIRSSRMSVNKSMYAELDTIEDRFEQINRGEKVDVVDLSKLENGLQEYGQYKKTIAELAQGLSTQLDQYVRFAAESRNYQGMEILWSKMGFTDKANRMRVQRLETQSPKESLEMIISYTNQLYTELVETRNDALEGLEKLQDAVDLTVTKIAEYGPKSENLKEKLDALEEKKKALDEAYKTADASDQVKLVQNINELDKQLTVVRHEYNQSFGVYKNAQEALQPNITARNNFNHMVDDLGTQATMLREKIDNVAEIYHQTPQAVKVMMVTRGTEAIDKTINKATEESLYVIQTATDAVRDTTLERLEQTLIVDEKMKELMDLHDKTQANFYERISKVVERAKQSQAERYALKTE